MSFFGRPRCAICQQPVCFARCAIEVVRFAFAKQALALLDADPLWERHIHTIVQLDATHREGEPA